MRRMLRLTAAGALFAFASIGFAAPSSADTRVEQTVVLQPGWNAVFLEVQPEPGRIAAIFDGIPVASVWHWSSGAGRVQFVSDPGETLLDQPGWRVWFPPAAGEKAVLTNLHALGANRAYLVDLGGDQAVTVTVGGKPSLRRPAWEANSFNLTGFPVDPVQQPTFASFFSASAEHSGQAVYRLRNGSWEKVGDLATARIRPGEAFWVYTDGHSDYAGPIEVELDFGAELDFGQGAPERSLRVRNRGVNSRSVSLTVLPGGGPVPLSKLKVGDEAIATWPDLASEPPLTVHGGTEELVRLAVRRRDLAAGESAGLLELKDGQGTRLLVPLAASALFLAPGEPDHRGLWIGTVTVNAVTEAQIPARPEFTVPQPTGAEFTFKLLVHVDAAGNARLLKEVIQMLSRVDGRPVLITDDGRVPDFDPVTLVGGEPFSHRISTAAYDFAGQSLALAGSFELAGSLAGSIAVPTDLSTNPFRHNYHPDHNNLDELDNPITDPRVMEVYEVSRALTLQFSPTSPDCAGIPGCVDPPDWGHTRMGGTYRETLTGLHRNSISAAGTFALQRVTDAAELNPVEVAP